MQQYSGVENAVEQSADNGHEDERKYHQGGDEEGGALARLLGRLSNAEEVDKGLRKCIEGGHVPIVERVTGR